MQIFPYLCSMISEKITKELLFCASGLLRKASKIVIVTHMSPDGDAMGSSLGLGHTLRALFGSNVTNIVPNAYPSFLGWIPGAENVLIYESQQSEADHAIEQADLIICTDFNEPKRIGAIGALLEQIVAGGKPCMVIDHHLANLQADFLQQCALCLIDHTSPAASALVYMLMQGIKQEHSEYTNSAIPLDAAICFYTGMMTDTGNFSFNSNYPYLYHIVAELVELGVNKDAIYNATFNQYTAHRMRLMGFCLKDKMKVFPEHHAALIYLSRKELYRYNFQSGDAEGIVNLPLQISDVYYSVFMREDKLADWEKALHPGAKTKVKISLRSQGERPVNIFAHDIFHGGGHANASGGEYYGNSVQEAVELFLANYKQYFLCS